MRLAHFNLGYSLSESGHLDDAIAEYRRSIECDGGDPVVHANLGLALARAGKMGDAIPSYRRSLELNPRNPAVHADLGEALFGSRACLRGHRPFEKSPGNRSRSADAHNKIGSILGKTGDVAGAIHAPRNSRQTESRIGGIPVQPAYCSGSRTASRKRSTTWKKRWN